MNIKIIFIILLLIGCNTTIKEITPLPLDGRKKNGTIRAMYLKQYNSDINLVVNWDKTKKLVSKKCKAWGYDDADPFGATTEKCLERKKNIILGNNYCKRREVYMQYQCVYNSKK